MWLISFIPYLLEVNIESWLEKKKKISASHAWTMLARVVLMVLVGFILVWANKTSYWYQGTALSAGIFIALFNYTYNILTGRDWKYLRNKGIDKQYKKVPIHVRLIWEACILGVSIIVYKNPLLQL